jgi:hypothetical protein
MAKVEHSIWRCTQPMSKSITGECDAMVIQQNMEIHLIEAHGITGFTPTDVAATFVLIRTGEVSRGPGRRKVIQDQTEPMFTPGKDFR